MPERVAVTLEGSVADLATTEKLELAGDRMTLTQTKDGVELKFGDRGTGRTCGSPGNRCHLCCKLLPIPDPELNKPAGVRCRHSRAGKGCAIYDRRPWACRIWACRWLADPEAAKLPRPDRAHYVIDMTEDTVRVVPHDGGPASHMSVLQVWCDPAFPNAWDTPELRAYMQHVAEKYRMATIVRYNSEDGFVVAPPAIADDGKWHTQSSKLVTREQIEHDLAMDRAQRRGAAV